MFLGALVVGIIIGWGVRLMSVVLAIVWIMVPMRRGAFSVLSWIFLRLP